VADLSFNILTKYQDRGVKQATKDFDRLGSKTVAVGSFIGTAMFGATKAVANFAKDGIGSVIAEAREAGKVTRITENVIRSTGGAAKISAAQVGKLAESLSNKTAIDDELVQSGANLLLCLEESAQALTRDRGWVTHDQLRVGDEILAYDPADDTSRWEPIQDFYRYQVDTELIHWKSKQIDVRTTPHHRWWTVGQNDKSSYTPKFQTTEEITGKQVRVKIGGGFGEGFAHEPTWSDDLIELAGWVISEGTVGWVRPSTPQSTQVRLTQSETANPEKVKRIRELMARLRFHGHRIGEGTAVMPYNGSTAVTWWIAHDLGATLRDMLPTKGLSMSLVTRLTREQASLLLDVLIEGDGHIDRHGHRQYVQKDREQLDVLAAMCAMLGIRTTDVPSRSTAGSLYLNTTNHLYGNRLNAERVRYIGVVWCPQIRTGIFMARNRGRTFWTGNTFKNIRNEAGKGNDIFNQATAAALDLSASGFGSVESASKMLGKALNDPLKGITALGRAGVTFTDGQKKQIKALVESGNVLGAQKIIMKEIASQVGGAAKAAADPMQRLGVIAANMKERIGTALLPIIGKVADWLGKKLPKALNVASLGFRALGAAFREGDVTSDGFVGAMEKIGVVLRTAWMGIKALVAAFKEGDVTSDGFVGVMERIGVAARQVAGFFTTQIVPAITGFLKGMRDGTGAGGLFAGVLTGIVKAGAATIAFFAKHTTLLKVLAVAIGAVVVVTKLHTLAMAAQAAGGLIAFLATYLKGIKLVQIATKVWTAFQWLLNAALNANPIGLVVIAIAALVTGLVIAYKRSETFRKIVDAAFRAVWGAAKFAFDWVKRNWPLLLAIITGPVGAATILVIKNWDRIRATAASLWSGLKSIWLSGVRFITLRFLDMVGVVIRGAAKALGWVPGVGPKLRSAAREFDKFRDRANAALGGVRDQSAQVRITLSEAAKAAAGYWGGRISASRAKALLIKASARGNLFEQHSPQIARGGAMRVWAEPETGGEAYIPLAKDSRRPRAEKILATVAERFGMRVDKFAKGGITVTTRMPTTRSLAMIAAAVGAGSRMFARDIARGVGARMKADIVGGLLAAAGPKDAGGGPVSPGLAGALRWARSQAGKPYIWGGVGPYGYDCSGFQSAITNVIRGRRPYSRLGSTGTFPWPGFVSGTGAYMIGSFRGSPGHMAGTLNGVNVESRGGEGVVIGSRARGARNSMFSTVRRLQGFARGGIRRGDPAFDYLDPRGLHFIGDNLRQLLKPLVLDQGGWLPPGRSVAYNGTGRPERVLPPRRGGDGAALPPIQFNHCTFAGTSQKQFEDLIVGAVDKARRKGRV